MQIMFNILFGFIKKMLTKIILIIKNYLKLFYYSIQRPYHKRKIKKFFDEISFENKQLLKGNILVDATFENPNYWIRLNLIFKALSLKNNSKTGILGEYSRKSAKNSLKIFDIKNVIDRKKIKVNEKKIRQIATSLLKNSKDGREIINWTLPDNFPGFLLYDSLLKTLKVANIDINNPKLFDLIVKELNNIEISKIIFSKNNFSLLICSHSVGVTYGSLIWYALKKNIDVICPYGQTIHRFLRFKSQKQLKDHILSTPTKKEFLNVSINQEKKFINDGKYYLNKRINGLTKDIGGLLAFKNKKNNLKKDDFLNQLGWNDKKKIVTIYTQNWADFPGSLGLKNFSDFKEWFDITLEEACQNKNLFWLFREHPISYKYGYKSEISVSSLVDKKGYNHVKSCPKDIDGKTIFNLTDYAITCLGSVGFEFSALNKKVLIADGAWYGNYGFGLVCRTKKDYIKKLKSNWWSKVNIKESRLNALKFIGIYWYNPNVQKDYIYDDDSKQDLIYNNLVNFFKKNQASIILDLKHIRSWYKDGHTKYHIFKKLRY